MLDLIMSDVFGFDHFRHFNRQGTNFPVTFTMKHMSRVAFLSRHPLMTGFYLTFIGACLYGPITLGKAVFLTYHSLAIRLGMSFEEN